MKRMTNKRVIIVVIAFLVAAAIGTIAILISCSSLDGRLCDYKAITIDGRSCRISSAELDMALEMYINSCGIDDVSTVEKMTLEQIYDVFGVKSQTELRRFVADEMIRHRVSEEIYAQVLENSLCSKYEQDEAEKFGRFIESKVLETAGASGVGADAYCQEQFQVSLDEYLQNTKEQYRELCVMRAILAREGREVLDSEIQDVYREISEEYEVGLEEAQDLFIREDIEYSLAYEKVYEVIQHYYGDLIHSNQERSHTELGLI